MSPRRLVPLLVLCVWGTAPQELAGAPPSPPASAPAVSKVTLTPGWATFGLSLPRGAAPSAVQVGPLATQTDVKNRWPDGSIRFAVVTCKAPAAGTFDITPAAPDARDFAPVVPKAAVTLTLAGTVYSAPLPSELTPDLWLSGGQVREWRAIVTPAHGANPLDPLRVIYDVRVYNDGQARLDVTVENVLDKRPADAVAYSVDVVADGVSLYAHAAFSHRWLARWRRALGIGLTASSVTHDFGSAVQANAIPRFWSGVRDRAVPDQAAGFDLMGIAHLSPSMCDCGGRGEMAPYPDWAADYLVHPSEGKRRYVLAHGEQAASWPVHLREPEGGRHAGVGAGRYVSLDQRPRFWFDNRGEDRPAGRVSVHYDGWGSGRVVPDIAHQPSLAFIPYLLTGDRYFLDEMVFWANFCLIATYNHGGAQALLHTNEHRGMAWAVRNLADAAAFAPDGDAVKAYLESKLKNNLAWFDDYANGHPTPLGHVFEYPGIPGEEDYACISLGGGYGQLAWALDRANKLGYPGGAALRDRMARFVLRLFTGEPDFPREAAMRLWLRVGPKGGTAFYRTLKELAEANPAGARHYNHWHRLALVIALENRWPGAREAYDYNWRLGTSGGDWMQLADNAGWAILPDMPAR